MFRKFSRTELVVYIAVAVIVGSVIMGIFASREETIKSVRKVPELASDLVVAINFNLKRLKTATLAPEVISPEVRILTFTPGIRKEKKIEEKMKEEADPAPLILKRGAEERPEEPDMALHGPAILPPEMLMPPEEEDGEKPEEPDGAPAEPEEKVLQDTLKNIFPVASMVIDNFVAFFSESHPAEDEKLDDFSAPYELEEGLHDLQAPPEEVIPETGSKDAEEDPYETEEEEAYQRTEADEDNSEAEDKEGDEDIYARIEESEEEEKGQEKSEDVWKDSWEELTESLIASWNERRENWGENWKNHEEEDDIDEENVFMVPAFAERTGTEEKGDDEGGRFSLGRTFFRGLQNLLQKKEVIQESQDHFKENGAAHIKDDDHGTFRDLWEQWEAKE